MSEHCPDLHEPSGEELDALANELGVTVASLRALEITRLDGKDAIRRRGCGFAGDALPAYAWVIPERDGDRQVTGLSLRAPDGRKGFVADGKRGIVVPKDLPASGREVFVVEGATDTAALQGMGLCVVGRPSNNAGAELLTELLAEFEDVYVLGEYDPKPNGKWPGWEGAEAIAGKLARKWSRSVYFSMPPKGWKDVRAWLQAQLAAGRNERAVLGEELAVLLRGQRQVAAPEGLRVVCMEDVEAKPIEWLWEPWLPRRKFVLMAGDAGVGKSVLLVDLIAGISSGRLHPDGEGRFEAGEVLIFAAEDDPEDTIKPRLLAAGADCRRVHLVQAVDRKEGEDFFDLTRDLPMLERELNDRPQVQVIVIDPVLSFTGRAQTNSHTEVRAITNALTKLASERDVLVLGIMHLNKNEDASVLTRVLGSGAWVQACRLALAVGEHPDDDDLRVVMPFKSNFGHEGVGMVFKIQKAEGADAARVEWLDERFDGEVEDLVRHGQQVANRRGSRDAAAAWLEAELADGPKPVKEIRQAALAARHAEATLKRAAKDLGVEKRGGPGSDWSLPTCE